MRPLRLAGRLAIGLALLTSPPALGAAGVELYTDFVSEYVFRGASRGQGTSVQPSLSYNIVDTVTASVWANLRLEGGLALSETDYTLQWTWLTTSPAAVTVGWVYYDTNRALLARETSELFAGLDLNLPGKPSLYVWYDYDTRPGVYWELSAAHRYLLPGYRGTIDLGAGLGFDTGRIGGFNDARLSLSFSRYVGEWRLTPGVDLHFPSSERDPGAHNFRPVFRFSASRSF